ncbi:MAG TPA: BTAD domain-containing putative transcriptional regulator [Acidimicrobiia bacterium]|nr:BTAD domain-containing putative transcriptional regulator [Acidimicrobiia bacterium]
MEFRILGPLEVVAAGGPVRIDRQRERALLVRLLLSANQVVSVDGLVEDLWAGDPPEAAAQAVWVHVSRLRKALRRLDCGDVLLTRAPGYLLQVEPERLDSARFERLVERGRQRAGAGDPAGAAEVLRGALALWRGSALADVAATPFAAAEATRLEEARLSALEERIDADLACGRHGALVGELAALTRQHPLRERLWGQRLVALYRSGRQAEALRASQELRRHLRDQLGIEPGAELRRLETAVLRHDPVLDLPAAPAPAVVPAAAQHDRVALPLPLERESSFFVGRDEELRRLEAAWGEARSGQRRVVLLAGEPGIGKTRLSAEIARRAYGEGAAVLFGRCDDGVGVPYQPFVEALGLYLRQARSPVLGRLGGELVRLIPEISDHVGGLPEPIRSDPETERYRLFDAVAAWLAAVSAAAPAVLVLDDLHWAGRPTLMLLSHLVRSGEPLRLLVVVTYRDTEPDVTADLSEALADLVRHPGVERLRLGGFDEAAVTAFMEAQAHHELDAAGRALAASVHAGTAGNPFFVGQLLRHLAETEAIVWREGRWTSERDAGGYGIPDEVRDVITRRLARLPAITGDRLGLASVIGDRFELDVLVGAAGDEEIATLEALEPALAARLIAEINEGAGSEYRFVHALVRATLYDALPRAQRLDHHRRCGEAIGAVHRHRLDDHLPALAHHFARAGREHRPEAMAYARQAGDRALAQLAHDEAVHYYGRALEFLDGVSTDPTDGERLGLLIALGEAQRRAGDTAHRETLLAASDLAAQRDDAAAAARAALANVRGPLSSTVGAVDDGRVAALEAALAMADRADSPTRARLLAALALELLYAGDRDRRRLLADDALAIARRSQDAATLAQVLLARFYTIYFPDTLDELLANTEELVELAENLSDPVITARASWVRFRALAESGEIEAADRHLRSAEQLAEELGQPTLRWLVGLARTGRTILAGDLDEAERRALANFELGRITGQVDASTFLTIQLVNIRVEQDRLGELEGSLADRVAAVPYFGPVFSAYLAFALCELGRPDEAIGHYEPLAAADFTALPQDTSWILAMPPLAAVCSHLGDRIRAGVLDDLLRPYAGHVVVSTGGALGAVDHYLGLLATTSGDYDEAERRFAVAAGIHQRIPAPIWLARTRLEWSRMLLARSGPGDTERARDLAGQALATARQRGLANIERRAAKLAP